MATGSMVALISAVVFLILGVPVAASFGISSIIFMLADNIPLFTLGQVAFSSVDKFAFLAIPLFVLTGELISAGGIAKSLVDLGYAWLGWIRGGLGIATFVACGFFAAISGSNSGTAAVMGKIMVPMMKDYGYKDTLGAAIAASGACMGIIIPPSIIYIIYGSLTGVSISGLFMAGIIPGILMILAMSVANYFVCKKYDIDPPLIKFTFKNAMKSAWDARWALGAPFIIMGGIYGGIATPTEAAAIAVLYCFIVGLLSKKITIKMMGPILFDSALVTGVVLPVVAMGVLFGEMLITLKIPEILINFLLSFTGGELYLTLFVFWVLLMIAGCVMETVPNILILAPIFLPIGNALGLDPIHMGMIMICTLTIGFVTPPFGLNLFAVSGVTGVEVMATARQAVPYIIAMCIALIPIYLIPQVSLFLASFMD